MQTEIEVKFPQIDIDAMRERLKEAGAVCEQPMRLMRRRTFDNNFMKQGKDAFARVRDEGHKITMTYKQFDSLSLHGAKEIEIEVSDFEKACELMFQIGAGEVMSSYQESRRETWRLGDVEIVIDEWPWLKPYIEVEGVSEEAVRKVADELGCDWSDAVFGDVMAAFRLEYPHLTVDETIGNLQEVRFGAPLPDFLKG
jgi:adenylate cyclase class 2